MESKDQPFALSIISADSITSIGAVADKSDYKGKVQELKKKILATQQLSLAPRYFDMFNMVLRTRVFRTFSRTFDISK